MIVPKPLQRPIVERGEMLIVLHGIFDAQRSATVDVLDEVLDEAADFLTVADCIDHRHALHGREIVRRGNHPRECDIGPCRERGSGLQEKRRAPQSDHGDARDSTKTFLPRALSPAGSPDTWSTNRFQSSR